MDIIFAMDIRAGIVVKGYKGERETYEPIERHSKICTTSDPLNVVRTIKPKRTYIADLDRIQGWGNNSLIIRRISARTKTLIDVGIRKAQEVKKAAEIGEIVIIGTETGTLDVIRKAQSLRIAVSVDIRNSSIISPDDELNRAPLEVIEKLNSYKIHELILLDISTVGTKVGVNLDKIRQVLGVTEHKLIVAGGIKNLKEIDALENLGVSGVIISTAIHEELIPIEVVR